MKQCNHQSHEIGYCKPHGDDARATEEMATHIKDHRECREALTQIGSRK